MKECSKSIQRRFVDSNFLRKYFIGDNLDISASNLIAEIGQVRTTQQPVRKMGLHLTQYKDDMQMMKSSNRRHPPFDNDSAL